MRAWTFNYPTTTRNTNTNLIMCKGNCPKYILSAYIRGFILDSNPNIQPLIIYVLDPLLFFFICIRTPSALFTLIFFPLLYFFTLKIVKPVVYYFFLFGIDTQPHKVPKFVIIRVARFSFAHSRHATVDVLLAVIMYFSHALVLDYRPRLPDLEPIHITVLILTDIYLANCISYSSLY